MALSNLIWWPWAQVGQGVAPVVPDNPVGDTGPIRRGRRRRLEVISADTEDLDAIASVLLTDV